MGRAGLEPGLVDGCAAKWEERETGEMEKGRCLKVEFANCSSNFVPAGLAPRVRNG